jgi:hypothetical protein
MAFLVITRKHGGKHEIEEILRRYVELDVTQELVLPVNDAIEGVIANIIQIAIDFADDGDGGNMTLDQFAGCVIDEPGLAIFCDNDCHVVFSG